MKRRTFLQACLAVIGLGKAAGDLVLSRSEEWDEMPDPGPCPFTATTDLPTFASFVQETGPHRIIDESVHQTYFFAKVLR